MTDFTKRDAVFERARSLQEKLARYADVERRYRELEEELRDLEADPVLRQALGLKSDDGGETVRVTSKPTAKAEPDGRPASSRPPNGDSAPAQASGGTPLSPTGRLQRGYLRKVMPGIARRRFDSATPTIGEIREVVAEELAYNIHRNSVKAFVKRWVEAGRIEQVEGSAPTRYRFILDGDQHQSGDSPETPVRSSEEALSQDDLTQ